MDWLLAGSVLLYLVGSFYDARTTRDALRDGRFKEQNPIGRFVLEVWGISGIGVMKLLPLAIFVGLDSPWWFYAGVGALFAAVGYRNARKLVKAGVWETWTG